MRRRAVQTVIFGLALVLWQLSAPAEGLSRPQINYMLHCQGCHLADGAGTPGKVPALKHEAGRFLRVPGGREYLIQVPGTAQSALSDADVATVLNWILQNFSFDELPADFVPYSEEEVARFRRKPMADVSAVRAALMARITE